MPRAGTATRRDEPILRHPKAVTFVKRHDAAGYCFKCTQKELVAVHHGFTDTHLHSFLELSSESGARRETKVRLAVDELRVGYSQIR